MARHIYRLAMHARWTRVALASAIVDETKTVVPQCIESKWTWVLRSRGRGENKTSIPAASAYREDHRISMRTGKKVLQEYPSEFEDAG